MGKTSRELVVPVEDRNTSEDELAVQGMSAGGVAQQ